MMKNKIKTICTVTATVTIAVITAAAISRSIHRCRNKKYRCKQLREYADAISDALTDYEVTDFDKFKDFLNEYYGIKAECVDGNTIIYSSDRYSSKVSGSDFWEVVPNNYNKNAIEIMFANCYSEECDDFT